MKFMDCNYIHKSGHVELQDDSETAIIKVTVYDAPMDMTSDKLRDIFSKFVDVIKVEDEMHMFNGRVTSWSTGNRIVSMTVIRQAVPTHMTGNYRGQLISINTWHRGQDGPGNKVIKLMRCTRCGLNSHEVNDCPEKEKLCLPAMNLVTSAKTVQPSQVLKIRCQKKKTMKCFVIWAKIIFLVI